YRLGASTITRPSVPSRRTALRSAAKIRLFRLIPITSLPQVQKRHCACLFSLQQETSWLTYNSRLDSANHRPSPHPVASAYLPLSTIYCLRGGGNLRRKSS